MNNGTTRPLGRKFAQQMKARKLAFRMFEKQTREHPSYENIIKWVEAGVETGCYRFFIDFNPENRTPDNKTHAMLIADAEIRLRLQEFEVTKYKALLKVFIPSKWA